MGLGDCLVGVDLYSDYPPDVVRALPKLGPDLDIDIERLCDLNPDLTVCSLSVPGMERVVESVRNAGLSYVVLSPHAISDIWQDMRLVADALDGAVPQNVLQTVISSLQRRVANIAKHTQTCEYRPKLYWEWWPNPVFSPAQSNWLTEISFLAGCVNIFADVEGNQVKDDGSRVVAANPDYLLAVWTGIPQHKVPLQKILAQGVGVCTCHAQPTGIHPARGTVLSAFAAADRRLRAVGRNRPSGHRSGASTPLSRLLRTGSHVERIVVGWRYPMTNKASDAAACHWLIGEQGSTVRKLGLPLFDKRLNSLFGIF